MAKKAPDVWLANDGTKHSTEYLADAHEVMCRWVLNYTRDEYRLQSDESIERRAAIIRTAIHDFLSDFGITTPDVLPAPETETETEAEAEAEAEADVDLDYDGRVSPPFAA